MDVESGGVNNKSPPCSPGYISMCPGKDHHLCQSEKKVWESLEKKRRRSACIREEEDPWISVTQKKLKIATSYVSRT